MAQVQPPVPESLPNMGEPIARYEARDKVTGKPLYALDVPVANPLHAYFLTSGIATGSVAAIDTSVAEAMPGVVKIYTHKNAPKRKALRHMMMGGKLLDTNIALTDAKVRHDGDIVAMIVADSYETARDAAHRIGVRYAETATSPTIGTPGAQVINPPQLQMSAKKAGDFNAAFAKAPVKIDQEYTTPTQHHNAIELFGLTAVWNGDELVVHEPTQWVHMHSNGLAEMLGIAPEKVRVVDAFVGGGFGGKLLTQRTALVAAAARELGRPVKLVLPRDQGFNLNPYRAETRHHIRLGAERNGKMTAYAHEGWEITSRADNFSVAGTEGTTEMYAIPNVWTKVNLVKADRNTPGFMRSPPETPYMFAFESAVDEMAVALGLDPVELRRINDTMKSPINGAPYTSRSLLKCYDQAAASFGWASRNPEPMSMRTGDWMVGYGCATATYPTNMMASTARIRLTSDGRAHVEVAAHDLGTGAYTVAQQVVAKQLGLDPRRITVEMGDSKLPPGPIAGGSMTTASVTSALLKAVEKIATRFGGTIPAAGDLEAAFARIGTNRIEEYAEWWPEGSGPEAVKALYAGSMAGGGQQEGDKVKPLMHAFGAEFVEVRVHRLTREIRVPRMTGAFAGGHIVNPRTARSQYLGGMIWGMSSALHEFTEMDMKRGRYVNDNIAEYLIPVNADVPQVDIIMVPEEDRQVNPLGVKGIGELANVGTAAAIANAVYHATGKRIRDLPITMDKLL